LSPPCLQWNLALPASSVFSNRLNRPTRPLFWSFPIFFTLLFCPTRAFLWRDEDTAPFQTPHTLGSSPPPLLWATSGVAPLLFPRPPLSFFLTFFSESPYVLDLRERRLLSLSGIPRQAKKALVRLSSEVCLFFFFFCLFVLTLFPMSFFLPSRCSTVPSVSPTLLFPRNSDSLMITH